MVTRSRKPLAWQDLADWRDVPGYEGIYRCNRVAQVKSLPHRTWKGMRGGRLVEITPGQPTRVPALVKPVFRRSNGRMQVQLSRDGIKTSFTVAAVVALTFLGPKPPGLEICHIDQDKSNDWAYNLEYNTHQHNVESFIATGLHHNTQKERCPRCGAAFTILPDGYRRCTPCMYQAHNARMARLRAESHAE
jgi:hypothetical protein